MFHTDPYEKLLLRRLLFGLGVLCFIVFGNCGGSGGSDDTTATITYTVGGTITGLTGTAVLQNNNADDLSISTDGSFAFATALADGAGYSVGVKTQPLSPNQTCSVSNGTGTVSGANVTNVTVACSINTYTIGGTLSGLSGSGLVLQNNDVDDLSISTDGSFAFATALADGVEYSVKVKTQPSSPDQICSVTSGSGTLSGSNVTSVSVTCVNLYSIGGNLINTCNGAIVLQNNGGDDLSVSANGAFTFTTKLANGAVYDVQVYSRPTPCACPDPTNSPGTINGADVTNVSVTCGID